MKSIQLVLPIVLFSFLFSSCVEVNLLDLIPEPSGDYCNQVNPDSSLDPLVWKAIIRDDSTRVKIESKILVNDDELVIINTFDDDISFLVIDRLTGNVLDKVTAELKSRDFDDAEIIGGRIIVTMKKEILAYDTKDYALLWQQDLATNIYLDGGHLTRNGNIIIPTQSRSAQFVKIELLTLSIENGQLLDRILIHEIEIQAGINTSPQIASISIGPSQNSISTVLEYWYPNREIDIMLIHTNFENIESNWLRKSTKLDKYYPGAIITENYVLFTSDSLYLLDKYSGTLLRSEKLEGEEYQHRKPIIEKIGTDAVLLKVDGQDMKLIDLVDMSTLWSEWRYNIYEYNNGEFFEDSYYNSTNLALSNINVVTGSIERWTELPYTCSYLDTYITIDAKHGILYTFDSTRLYAFQLD